MDSFFGSDVVRAERAAFRNMQRAMDTGDVELVLGWAYLTMRLRGEIGCSLLRKVENGDVFGVFELLEIAAGGAAHDD